MRIATKISKLCVTGRCERNSPVISEFPAQMASNAENVSIWWRHHVSLNSYSLGEMGLYFVESWPSKWEVLSRSNVCVHVAVKKPCNLVVEYMWISLVWWPHDTETLSVLAALWEESHNFGDLKRHKAHIMSFSCKLDSSFAKTAEIDYATVFSIDFTVRRMDGWYFADVALTNFWLQWILEFSSWNGYRTVGVRE